MKEYLPKTIYLVDTNVDIVDELQYQFRFIKDVEVVHDDYFSVPTNAIVSPANSFGIMDDGIDKAIVKKLGDGVQKSVVNVINAQHNGELPVGCAIITVHSSVTTKNTVSLITAPTMRLPDDVSKTYNAYLAFRAALLLVIDVNRKVDRGQYPAELKIDTLSCCGLCTGIGLMSPDRAARQMRLAYEQACTEYDELNKRSIASIKSFHSELLR